MRKLWIILPVGLLAAVFVGATILPSASDAGGGRMGHHPFMRLLMGVHGRALVLHSELDLSDAQRDQIHSVLQSHHDEIMQQISPVMLKARTLRNAVLAESTDEKAIRAAADDLGKSIGDAAMLAAKVRGEVRPILTEDQYKTVQAFHADNDKAIDTFLQQIAPTH